MQEKQTEAPNSAGGRRKIFSQKNMSFNSEKLYLGVGGSKITVDSDCSHEIKRHLLLERRRQWHPTPVLLPGESQGPGSLVGCCLWGLTESDTGQAI